MLRVSDSSTPKCFSNKVPVCFVIRQKKTNKNNLKKLKNAWALIHLLLEAFKVQT